MGYMREIPIKLASLNEYVNMCRSNRYMASAYKRKVEKEIGEYIATLPKFENPVQIDFLWVEKNNRRDYDNIAFGKKFILDALVKSGKLMDDNRKCVVGFTDSFGVGDRYMVILDIREVKIDDLRARNDSIDKLIEERIKVCETG